MFWKGWKVSSRNIIELHERILCVEQRVHYLMPAIWVCGFLGMNILILINATYIHIKISIESFNHHSQYFEYAFSPLQPENTHSSNRRVREWPRGYFDGTLRNCPI